MPGKNHISEVKTAVIAAIPETKTVELYSGRKKLLELTDSLIEETFNRISGERFRLRDGDRERLAYLRTLVSLIALYDSLLKDGNAPSLDGINSADIEARTQREKKLGVMFDF